MKFVPFIWAALRRKPVHAVLIFTSALFCFALIGVALGAGHSLAAIDHGGRQSAQLNAITETIAAIGLAIITVLTWNAVSHSVRLRMPELTILKALGYSTGLIITLIWSEAAAPSVVGAAMGLLLSRGILLLFLHLLPRGDMLPVPPWPLALFATGLPAAVLVAGIASAIPALRISRADVASELARLR